MTIKFKCGGKMNNKKIYLIFIFILLSFLKINVNASLKLTNKNDNLIINQKQLTTLYQNSNSNYQVIRLANTPDLKCENIFGEVDENGDFAPETLGYWLKWILDIIKYIAIVALIVLSSVDFFKAMISNDKDAMKKAQSTTIKRFIYAILIFFLPIIIEILMKQFGVTGTCGIE